ncbi:hypothetical protein pipiens_016404, partial [Culex pipiens pipiens]
MVDLFGEDSDEEMTPEYPETAVGQGKKVVSQPRRGNGQVPVGVVTPVQKTVPAAKRLQGRGRTVRGRFLPIAPRVRSSDDMPMIDLTGEENAMIADRAIEAMPLVEASVPSTIDPADPKRAALMVSNRSGVKRLEVGSLEKLKDDQTRRRLDRCRMPFNCFVDSGASNHMFYDQLVFDA